MIVYQLWMNDELTDEFATLPEAISKITDGESIEDTIRYYQHLDPAHYYLLSTKKGKKMDIPTLLQTGSEEAASIARLNAIRLERQKKKYKTYTFRLDKQVDYSLIAFLAGKDNLNEYLKTLIKTDFEKDLYPVSEDGQMIFATSAVRRLMVVLDITPYMLGAESFKEMYPVTRYGIIVVKVKGRTYARYIDEPEDVSLDYKAVG